jgi:acyl-coenzyme A thioesterase 9
MEITVWLEQFAHGHWEKMTRALFLMASRNSTNDGPAFVNSLVSENEEEKEILLGGESKHMNLILQNSSKMSSFPSQKI